MASLLSYAPKSFSQSTFASSGTPNESIRLAKLPETWRERLIELWSECIADNETETVAARQLFATNLQAAFRHVSILMERELGLPQGVIEMPLLAVGSDEDGIVYVTLHTRGSRIEFAVINGEPANFRCSTWAEIRSYRDID